MPPIVQQELLDFYQFVACRNKQELAVLDSFLKRFQIIDLNSAIELLGQYRLSHGLLIPNALIASTALHLNKDLATKNQRDYRFIEHLTLLPY